MLGQELSLFLMGVKEVKFDWWVRTDNAYSKQRLLFNINPFSPVDHDKYFLQTV